jgi:putative phosphoesterase
MKGFNITIGLISDTHGLLRNSAKQALQGVDLIIHAGDINTPEVLDGLEKIAPVSAVRGNMDVLSRTGSLPKTDLIEVEGIVIYAIHDIQKMDLDPAAAGISAVVFGHSHQPIIYNKDGVIFINPGSAGPKRFKLPISLGRLTIGNGRVIPEIFEIAD